MRNLVRHALVLLVLAALAVPAVALAVPVVPPTSDTHLAYMGSTDPVKANYGRGDYVFDTVEFTGSALSGNSVLDVDDLERLATDGSTGLGYENTYSMLTSGSVFSQPTLAGVKLYDLLVRLGLDTSAPGATPVRVYGTDGYNITLTLAQVEDSSQYDCYAGKDDPTVEEASVPVMLSFAVDTFPLIGPVGDDPVSKVFTPAEGYDPASDNSGGPIRLTVGQTSDDDFNARLNVKWVTRIVVGSDTEPTHTGAYASWGSSPLAVNIYDSTDATTPLESQTFSLSDLEGYPATMRARNFYDDGGQKGFYEGIDLWQFLSQKADLPGYEGTATFRSGDGETVTVDLAYLRNLGSDYSTYTVAKTATLTDGSQAGLTIDGVRPILAFAKNGYPLVATAGDAGYVATGPAGAVVDNDGGPLTLLLPADATYLPDGAHLDDVTGIDLSVEVPTDTHSGAAYADLAAQTISFTGAGIKNPSTPTVADLEKHIELMVTHDYGADEAAPGEYHGLDLLSLLQCSAFGLAVDADSVTVTGADGSSVSLSIADLTQQASPALLSFSRGGKPLVVDASSPEYDPTADNIGGPLMLVSDHYTVADVTSLSVSLKNGLWTHTGSPYSSYLQRALTISGSEVRGTTILSLAQLEALPYVRDSFAASKGEDACQGTVLAGLIMPHLAAGLTRPTKITVYGGDGYNVALPVDDVLNGIDSTYQPGQHRDVILAYSENGYPLVSSPASDGYVADAFNDGGPLHLVVENTISAWVKNVRAIVVGTGKPVYAADRVPSTAVTIVSPTVGQARTYLAKGNRLRLSALLLPASSTDACRWSSSRPACVSIFSRGVALARAKGRAVITVRTTSGQTDSIMVCVVARRDARAVTLRASTTLRVGQSVRLVATVAPAASTSQISWQSSDPAVATVDRGGTVVARRKGTTTITVTTSNGKRATCRVIVRS